MADNILNKLFVLVKAGTYTDIQSIIAASTANAKIYFVEDRNEIITKGKQYGASPETIARIAAAEEAIATLNGDENTAGSVKKQIADAVAAVVAAAPEAFNTLQEIAAWIAGEDGQVAKTAEQLIVAVGDQAHKNAEGEDVASTGLYKYAEDQAAAALASATEAIAGLDYEGGEFGTGKYVSVVTQADGKVAAVYTELPSVTDAAVTGQYVSAISQEKGEIKVTRAALPTLSVAADSDNFAGVSDHEISIKTKEITGTGASFAEGEMTASAYVAEAGLATATDVVAKLNAESTTVASAINSLDGRIDSLEALKHTIVNPKAEGHVTVAVTDENVVTISENDIASASELSTLAGVVGASTDATTVDTVYGKVNKNAAAIETLNGGVGVVGSVAKSINDAILDLDATVGSQTVAEGKHIAVEVVETDGKLSALTVVENDIASKTAIEKLISDEKARAEAAELALDGRLDVIEGEGEGSIKKAVADEASRADAAEKALAGRLDVIEGEGAGSISKAVADAKAAIEGSLADTDAKTLAALNDKIEAVAGDAKSYELRTVTLADSNVKEAFGLFDEDNVQVGATIKIYKDSALQSAVLGKAVVTEGKAEEDCLILTYLDVNGASQVVNIPLGDFLRESEFGNGLAVAADGVVSVKIDAASESFLSVSEAGVKLAGVQDAIDAAAGDLADRLDVIQGEATVEGSIKKAVADEKARAEEAEGNLQDAIDAEAEAARAAEKAINDKIGTVEAGKTVVGLIEEAKSAAIAAGTVVTLAEGTDKITLGSSKAEDGHVTYTIGQNDIASAQGLADLKTLVGTSADAAGASSVYGAIKQEVADREALAAKVGTVPEGSATVIDYINTKSAAVEGIINGLDATVNITGSLISGTATQTDGKLVSISLNDEAVASKTELTDAINALDANITSTGGAKVTVNIVETDGKLTSATVTETDIASATELAALDAFIGELPTGITATTVVGYIDEKTAAAEAAAKSYVDTYDFWETYQAQA